MTKNLFSRLFGWSSAVPSQFKPADNRNRFAALNHRVMAARWYVSILVILIMGLILTGIALSIAMKIPITHDWKEILLLLLGALIGSFNRVVDFWFNSQHNERLLEKMDQENDSEAVQMARVRRQAGRKGDQAVADALVSADGGLETAQAPTAEPPPSQ